MGHDDFREDPIVDFEVSSTCGRFREVIRERYPCRAADLWVQRYWDVMGCPKGWFNVYVLGPVERSSTRPKYTIRVQAWRKIMVNSVWEAIPEWIEAKGEQV
jgi:hypothetical protein